MARHQGTVLVDTNIILEAYQSGSWRALAGGYRVAVPTFAANSFRWSTALTCPAYSSRRK